MVFPRQEMKLCSLRLAMTTVMRLLISSVGVWCRTHLPPPNLVWDSPCSYTIRSPHTSSTRKSTIRTDLISRMAGSCWLWLWTTSPTRHRPQSCSRWETVSPTRRKRIPKIWLDCSGFKDSRISRTYTLVDSATCFKLVAPRSTETLSEGQSQGSTYGAKSLMFA